MGIIQAQRCPHKDSLGRSGLREHGGGVVGEEIFQLKKKGYNPHKLSEVIRQEKEPKSAPGLLLGTLPCISILSVYASLLPGSQTITHCAVLYCREWYFCDDKDMFKGDFDA